MSDTPDLEAPVAAPCLVWWTSQADHERVLTLVLGGETAWPDYLATEFDSRAGRAGRGRIWLSPEVSEFPDAGCPWDDESPVCKIASDAGGIPIHGRDAHHVASLPGFLTTVDMKLWSPLPTEQANG